MKTLSTLALLSVATGLAACSSPDGPGGDIPACIEATPTGAVFADLAVTADNQSRVDNLEIGLDGRIFVPLANGVNTEKGARIWDGARWTTVTPIVPAGALAGYNEIATGGAGSKFALFSAYQFPGEAAVKARAYIETAPGAFSAEEIPGLPLDLMFLGHRNHAAYLSDRNRLGVTFTNIGATDIVFAEKSDGVAWHVELAAHVVAPERIVPLAAGYELTGTAFIVATRSDALGTRIVLYRRAGALWTESQTLYSTSLAFRNPYAYVTPESAAQRQVHIGWTENGGLTAVRALTFDVGTQVASAPMDLLGGLPNAFLASYTVDFATSPDGATTVYSIWHSTAFTAWMGAARDGGGFSAAKPYHPELSQGIRPAPFFSPCGGAYVLTRAYANGGQASAKVAIETLATSEL